LAGDVSGADVRKMTQRVVVVGATGQIGRPSVRELLRSGHSVVVFSRDPARASQLVPGAADYVAWSPGSLSEENLGQLGSADAVIYLAGAPLFDGVRHNRAYVETELQARTDLLGQLVTALGGLSHRPATLIAASSGGAYGFEGRSDVPVDETYPAGRDFWGQDHVAMEQAALAAQAHGIRTVVLRTGYVIDRHNLDFQLQPFNHHMGGWVGTGRGWTPWIHMDDEVGGIAFALRHPGLNGPVNLVAPGSVRLRDFSRTLGRTVGHRAWLPVPTPAARAHLGIITDIITGGKRITPAELIALGYQFKFPTLDAALHDVFGQPDNTAAAP
jgi:uncharacterized protein